MRFQRVAMIMVFALIIVFVIGKAEAQITLEPIGTYSTGVFDESAAEIVAYDWFSQQIYVTNVDSQAIDIIDISDPYSPVLVSSIDVSFFGDAPTSVAVSWGRVAVAIPADPAQDPGTVAFFDDAGNFVNSLQVGPNPDMITFSHNGDYLLVANEGVPNDDYDVDPEGSISIIRTSWDMSSLTQDDVETADFLAFNDSIDPDVRIYGPGATVAQDLEPEFITVSQNSRTAWITLQDNNAIAELDIRSATITNVWPLGYQDHSLPENAFDASNRDDEINITTWPVLGMFQPDGIDSYRHHGRTYLVTANEGSAREYDEFEEVRRVKKLDLDADIFPDADDLQENELLGRLEVTTVNGDYDDDGDYDDLYMFGTRSFSIWSTDGELIWDSGSDFEMITADLFPDYFNSNNDENGFDSRSDDNGPAPEGVTLGRVMGRTYAFVGLERISGIMVYDITNPYEPTFIEYAHNRDFTGDPEEGTSGDLGPEGLRFISAWASPIFGTPLLVVANEVSGTTTVYAINKAR